jgi:uroporphyrinogen-III synthase
MSVLWSSLKVLLLRTRQSSPELQQQLALSGLYAVQLPVTDVEKVPLGQPVNFHAFDWVIISSQHAALFYKQLLVENQLLPQGTPPVAAIGDATAHHCQRLNLPLQFQPKSTVNAETAMSEFLARPELKRNPLQLLWPKSDQAQPTIQTRLSKAGHHVQAITVYRSVPVVSLPASIRHSYEQSHWDVVIAFSSTCAEAWSQLGLTLANRPIFIGLGMQTTRALRRYFPTDKVLTCESPTAEGILGVLQQAFPSAVPKR